jgi:hypothetical protein
VVDQVDRCDGRLLRRQQDERIETQYLSQARRRDPDRFFRAQTFVSPQRNFRAGPVEVGLQPLAAFGIGFRQVGQLLALVDKFLRNDLFLSRAQQFQIGLRRLQEHIVDGGLRAGLARGRNVPGDT